jgi:hypothetical protein
VLLAPAKKSYPFEVTQLLHHRQPPRLSVWLQGASDFEADPDHHLRVSVNGSLVEEITWDGKTARAVKVELLPGILKEGENTLELESLSTGATYSMVFFRRTSSIQATFPLSPSNRNNRSSSP